jgi:hypothetical protein
MKRIARMSSSFVSFLWFANPEKGDPNSGMTVLLSECSSDFLPNVLFSERSFFALRWKRLVGREK